MPTAFFAPAPSLNALAKSKIFELLLRLRPIAATIVFIPDRLAVTFWFLLLLGRPKDDLSIERDRLQHDVVPLAILMRKGGTNGGPPIILTFAAFGNGIRGERRLLLRRHDLTPFSVACLS